MLLKLSRMRQEIESELLPMLEGSLNTKNAIDPARHAEKIKLDGVSSIPPTCSFAEVFGYYKEVAESISLPLNRA